MKTASQTRPPWGDIPIDSVERVLEAIKYLGMPTPFKNSVELIVNSPEKGKFRSAIEECLQLNNVQCRDQTKRYLFGLVTCISEVMYQSLKQLGYDDVSPEALIHTGKTNGMAFRSAMKSAVNKNDSAHVVSLSMIDSTIAAACDELDMPHPTVRRPRAVQTQQSPKSKEISSPSPAPATAKTQAPANESRVENDGEYIDEKDKGYLSTHVYGGKAALCFNAAMSRNRENHTIMLDAALSIGEKKYDWPRAVTIQLGHKELPLVYGVLVGWRNAVRLDAHGVANEKCFEIERQDGNLFAKVLVKGGSEPPRAVPIGPLDAYAVLTVVFAQIMKQAAKVTPGLRDHPDVVIHMMKQTQMIAHVNQP